MKNGSISEVKNPSGLLLEKIMKESPNPKMDRCICGEEIDKNYTICLKCGNEV